MDDRWLHPSPRETADRFVAEARERLRLILDDLAELPRTPAVIAEGPQLLPSPVAPRVRAREARGAQRVDRRADRG
jgi:hypothetical protein